jgi:hypothetical protein
MNDIPLIHPIYLDVPMLVSFAAAVQGGISLASEITQENKLAGSGSGNASVEFNLSSLFKSLFETSAKASGEATMSRESQVVRKESRSYTEASIAIILYHELKQKGRSIIELSKGQDTNDLPIGALVEISGTIEKNTIDSIIDYAAAADILSGMAPDQAPGPAPSGGRGKLTSPANPKQQRSEAGRIADLLDQDRKRTPISNVILRTPEALGLGVVISLRTANLRDLTLSELHKNNVRVVGKVTRHIPAGDSMVSFENYGMAMLDRQKLSGLFEGIATTEGFAADLGDFVVEGPAIQVLPLMIFV